MKKLIKNFISYLFFKFCFQESEMAHYLTAWLIPNTIRKTDYSNLDGKFLFAQIEDKVNSIHYKPLLDVPVCGLDIKYDEIEKYEDWSKIE